ncbi:MAG: sacsin N-terminal ATP-binding-like domain-containing protein [Pyrinomonadaceae bacterium]
MDFFEELSKNRTNWVESNKKNNFDTGISNLLTELYPDNAHFIYELLQNAEDAKATKAKFVLTNKELRFSHDGTRRFTKDDIESITSIGNSQKKDDANQIGKFGVGFKSVFSYTNSPKIHSGEWSFEIQDLVCPSKIDPLPESDDKETVFLIPFTHKEKKPETAFNEIKKILFSLPDTTILFLQNIKQIEWEIEDQLIITGHLKIKVEDNEGICEIEKKSETNEISFWLRYFKDIPEKEGLSVSIAFRLKKDKKPKLFKIDETVKTGTVSIFFPAEKEASGLKFFIHAPFAATVARDSIQNRQENNQLRNLLVELLSASVQKVKRLNLLDSNFLSILPNNEDDLQDFYQPFRSKMIEDFTNNDITPTYAGNFQKATNLLQADLKVKKIINRKSILPAIFDENDIDWVCDTGRNSRATDFIESLEIEELNMGDLIKRIGETFQNAEIAETVLSNQTDDWMRKFYAFLGTKYYYYDDLADVHLIRTTNNEHLSAKNVFFKGNKASKYKGIKFVKPETYLSAKKKEDPKAKEYLEEVGVKVFDETDEIRFILNEYYDRWRGVFSSLNDSSKFTESKKKTHLSHIRKFIKFLNHHPKNASIFSDARFLRTEDGPSRLSWFFSSPECIFSSPECIFIDAPYQKTNLSIVSEHLDERQIWSGYAEFFNGKEKQFSGFLSKIGIVSKLKIVCNQNPWDNPGWEMDIKWAGRRSHNRIFSDFKIKDLEEILEKEDVEVNKLVWKSIILEPTEKQELNYRPNASARWQRTNSLLVYILRTTKWIPDKEGKFYKPEDISEANLHPNFVYENKKGWMTALGIGLQEEAQRKEELKTKQSIRRKNEAATKIGFKDAAEAEEAKKLLAKFKNNPEIAKQAEKAIQRKEQKEAESKSPRENALPESTQIVEPKKLTESNNQDNEVNAKKRGNKIELPANENMSMQKKRNQKPFRQNLEQFEDKCRITGLEFPELLIASHIKPWKDCKSDNEKIDGNNGLFLSPHIDKLFDKGYISFSDEGEILIHKINRDEIRKVFELWKLDWKQSAGEFNEKQKIYLAFHRKKFGFD